MQIASDKLQSRERQNLVTFHTIKGVLLFSCKYSERSAAIGVNFIWLMTCGNGRNRCCCCSDQLNSTLFTYLIPLFSPPPWPSPILKFRLWSRKFERERKLQQDDWAEHILVCGPTFCNQSHNICINLKHASSLDSIGLGVWQSRLKDMHKRPIWAHLYTSSICGCGM